MGRLECRGIGAIHTVERNAVMAIRLSGVNENTRRAIKATMPEEVCNGSVRFSGSTEGTIVLDMDDPIGFLNEVLGRAEAERYRPQLLGLFGRVRRFLDKQSRLVSSD